LLKCRVFTKVAMPPARGRERKVTTMTAATS
jgi:hypothetical protein